MVQKIRNTEKQGKALPRMLLMRNSRGDDFPEDFLLNYHTHLLCEAGEIIFEIGDTTLICKRGEFVFWLAGNSSVSNLRCSSDFKAHIFFVENQYFRDAVPDQNWGVDAVLYARKFPVKQLDSEEERKRILSNFQRLFQVYEDNSHRFYEEVLKLQTRIFIFEMWHVFAKAYERRSRTIQSSSLYEQFIHLIELHCVKEREVQFYAQQLHISPKHLNYICQQNSGTTASEWIKKYTKERLIHMLQNKDMNIAEITYAFNFSSRSYFTRYVKKLLGVTPTAYRNRMN